MKQESLTTILEHYKDGTITLPQALNELKDFPTKDLSFAQLDTHRQIRTGYPEVIYCAGKTPEQLHAIMEFLLTKQSDILATRADNAHFEAVKPLSEKFIYDQISRTITLRRDPSHPLTETAIAVVTAGTSDIPVAEEAAVTAELFGNKVIRIYDVGVAGLHRVMNKIELLRSAKVIIAVAGMEGALPSVLGGLIDAPIIACPTSVGYGASFHGLSALLTMLNSCAAGISVVNIDNGFGAGYMAGKINRL
jgi:hypothetical protein